MKGTFLGYLFIGKFLKSKRFLITPNLRKLSFGFIRNDNSIFVKGGGKPGRFELDLVC